MSPEVSSFRRRRDTAASRPPKAVVLGQAKRLRTSLPAANSFRPGIAVLGTLMVLGLVLVALTGCHSAFVNATVSNHTAAPISVVQVEYPSASFGTQTIAPGADFHYRFKVLGSGSMKITYTDSTQKEHKATGPSLNESTEGTLTITVAPDGVHWQSPPPSH